MLGRFVAVVLLAAATPSLASAGTILAVFAHPDDEISVAPALAKYAAEGHEVYLLIATSGQTGDGNTDIPAGPQLGAAREEEVRCSAARLGVHEPILLQLQNGGLANSTALRTLRGRLLEVVDRLEPDVMITWGPDGLTGHPDHRLVSDVASEAFFRHEPGRRNPRKLYYVAIAQSAQPADPGVSGVSRTMPAVSDGFITTVIDGGDFAEQTFEAMQCHVTQWAPIEKMKALFEARVKALGGKVYFRLAGSRGVEGAERESDLFADLD